MRSLRDMANPYPHAPKVSFGRTLLRPGWRTRRRSGSPSESSRTVCQTWSSPIEPQFRVPLVVANDHHPDKVGLDVVKEMVGKTF